MRARLGLVLLGLLAVTTRPEASLAAAEQRLAQAARTLPAAPRGGDDVRDRERARRECARVAERRGFEVRGSTPPRADGEHRLRLRMDLRRRGEHWLGTCTFDRRERRAELDASRTGGGRPGAGEGGAAPGRGPSASAGRVRDACIREVSQNARTQLVSTGRIERRSGGATVMPMTINVEGSERRVRCFYDNATGAVTIR